MANINRSFRQNQSLCLACSNCCISQCLINISNRFSISISFISNTSFNFQHVSHPDMSGKNGSLKIKMVKKIMLLRNQAQTPSNLCISCHQKHRLTQHLFFIYTIFHNSFCFNLKRPLFEMILMNKLALLLMAWTDLKRVLLRSHLCPFFKSLDCCKANSREAT